VIHPSEMYHFRNRISDPGKTLKSKRFLCYAALSEAAETTQYHILAQMLEEEKQQSSRKSRSASESPKHCVSEEARSVPLAQQSAWQKLPVPVTGGLLRTRE
jgi:hypothetical protein